MKRYITANNMIDEEYIPNITFDDGEDIVVKVISGIKDRLLRRYKNIYVDADDINVQDNRVQFDVEIYHRNRKIRGGQFYFHAYDSYFDYSDYESHLNRTIDEFVRGITSI